MAENVFEVIQQHHPRLIPQLINNADVSEFLMGFYAQLLYTAQGESGNPADILCGVEIGKERLLVVKTWYQGSSDRTDVGNRLPRQRNLNLVKLLQVNKSVRDVPLFVIHCLESWMNDLPFRKEQGWGNIKLQNGMRWKDGTFTAEIILKIEFDGLVNAKMNWPTEADAPEQPTEGSIIT